MSSESKFWIAVNSIVWTAIVLIVMLSTMYWKDHNTKIVEMVSNGVNPVAAMCAMQDDYGNSPVCVLLATKNAISEQKYNACNNRAECQLGVERI